MSKMKKSAIVTVGFLAIMMILPIIFLGCVPGEDGALDAASGYSVTEKQLPVIAVTIVPEATFVKAVCGELAEVVVMVPPGASPENYEPTPSQMEQFYGADLYFAMGVPVEETAILPNAGDLEVIFLSEEVAAVYPDLTFSPGQGTSEERDPHIWLSPKRVEVMVNVIAREMSKIDPQNSETYEKNAGAYIEELEALDQQIKAELSGVKNRKFVSYHPAFSYIADDYGLEMFALEEEGKEASPRHLQEMIDLAKKENIKVIFYQEEFDSRQAEAYAQEIGGKTMKLAPLAADYVENMKRMADTIASAME